MKTVCFGEIMGRLNPVGYMRIVQSDSFEISYGGAEANVAVCLSNFGKETSYVTKLPNNEIAQAALRSLQAHGVYTKDVVFGGERIGLYFLEKGASQRPSTVIYDRKHSSISEAKCSDFDWNKIFEGADWFHFTGITPALGDNVAEICRDACEVAKKLGIRISCDLNYRSKLWSVEKASQTMVSLMKYVDVLIANEEHSDKLFGIKAPNEEKYQTEEHSKEKYKYIAKGLSESLNIPTVALTFKTTLSANENIVAGMLYVDNMSYFSKQYTVNIVDSVGGGDAFGAGLIYAIQEKFPNQEAVEFAEASLCLKHSINYDYNEVSVDEVNNLMNGNGVGRLQR